MNKKVSFRLAIIALLSSIITINSNVSANGYSNDDTYEKFYNACNSGQFDKINSFRINFEKDDYLLMLISAAEYNRIDVVKELIERRLVNVNDTFDYNYTALMAAAENDSIEVAEYLLQNGAFPNIPNEYGDTAISIVNKRQNINMQMLFLSLNNRAKLYKKNLS